MGESLGCVGCVPGGVWGDGGVWGGVGCSQSPCSTSGLWAQACLAMDGGAGGARCLSGPGAGELFGVGGVRAMNEDACGAPGSAERRTGVSGL